MKSNRFLTLCIILFLSGCSNLEGVKLLMPERFGLVRIQSNLYVEEQASNLQIDSLKEAVLIAESSINKAYGSVESAPIINACVTQACYEAFGGKTSKAKVYGNRILLSPRGLNWHLIAHEWSHDEIRTWLGLWKWRSLPQWFDEGLAVAISEAPEHSEAHWDYLVSANIPKPSKTELRSYTSLKLWHSGVRKYGATLNIERVERGEIPIAPVYAAAGHEVRPWLSKIGASGLIEFIEQLKSGEAFEDIFE